MLDPNLANIASSLLTLIDEIRVFLRSTPNVASTNSPASEELRKFPQADWVQAAYDQADLLLDTAADQMIAFARTIVEPVLTMAPWTTVRAALEACALASWLLDPTIDSHTRVQRSVAFRFDGLTQQLKFNRAAGDKVCSDRVINRMDEVERLALELGFLEIRNRSGKRIGIGQIMPDITSIVRDSLKEEVLYRALSAIAHAHPWALLQMSYRGIHGERLQYVEDSVAKAAFPIIEKHLEYVSALLLRDKLAANFAKAVWYKCQLFGWNLDELERTLERESDSIGIRDHRRFWRTKGDKLPG